MLNSPDPFYQAEAAIRMGDLYLVREQYERALGTYFQAAEKFPEEAKLSFALQINRAETLYWIGEWERSKQGFETILSKFTSHAAGWRATYRLAEIAARTLGRPAAKARYDETINRYPYSPGKTLANLALIPCGDHGGFTPEAAKTFLTTDTKSLYDPVGEVITTYFQNLRALARVRALAGLGNDQEAVLAAIEELRSGHIHGVAKSVIGKSLRGLFRKAILASIREGKGQEAIRFYRARSSDIEALAKLQPSEKVPPDYLLRLSQVAAELRLADLSSQLSESYQRAVNLREPASTNGEPREQDPEEALLGASVAAYTAAQAKWLSGKFDPVALRATLARISPESSASYPKEVLLGLLEEREGHTGKALQAAKRARVLLPAAHQATDQDRIDGWIATLQTRQARAESRDELLLAREILKRLRAERPAASGLSGENRQVAIGPAEMLGVPDVPSEELLLLKEGELLVLLKSWTDATDVFGILVDRKLGGAHALYQFAHAAIRSQRAGDAAKGREALVRLSQSDTAGFWRKLASEQLANQKFLQTHSQGGLKQ